MQMKQEITCEEFEAMGLDAERNASLSAADRAAAIEHAGSCSRCAALQDSWQAAGVELRAFAEDTAMAQAPPRVEMRLRQEFRTRHVTLKVRRTAVVAAWTLAAAASVHAATTAVRRTFNVTCRVRNSWRKRISTRGGACAMAVSSANARSSTPAACQESCNAAQREQDPACSIAAARSAALNDALRSASNPIASNSSHVISCFICITQNPSPRNARALRHAAKYFQFGHQQGATAVQPRTNRANRASRHLRGFPVTHFFQLTKHYSFAKLLGHFLTRGHHWPPAFALFCPNRRRQRVVQNNAGARAVLVFFLARNFPLQTFQVFHHAIARHSIKKGPERSARGVIFFRITHQGHEHVLHNLFCGPGISRHAQGKAIHGRLVPPVDEGESFLIAFGGPPQQNVVSLLLGDSHLPWYDVLGCSHLSIPAAE